MGAILRAFDRVIHRTVAMKVMLGPEKPDRRARFVEEARITGQLEHPNIVPIHALGEGQEGRPFFTMKLVKGRSLAEVLDDLRKNPDAAERKYPLGRMLGILTSVCHAMAYAHAKGVVHRDLKPANIIIGDYGETLVMDWGLAKVGAARPPSRAAQPGRKIPTKGPLEPVVVDAGGDAADERLASLIQSFRTESGGARTEEGTVAGTPAYMSPEQACGEIARIDARSDIYALGAILYEILTLTPPPKGTDARAILLQVTAGWILPPEKRAAERAAAGKIPKELSAIAMKALAQEPGNRYASVEELRRDIELFVFHVQVSAGRAFRSGPGLLRVGHEAGHAGLEERGLLDLE